MSSLIKHFENCLGPILDGWTSKDAADLGFQIVRFNDKAHKCDVFATLGLSGFGLRSKNSGREIRCELIMAAPTGTSTPAAVLHRIASFLINARRAPLRGEVIGPAGKLPGSDRLWSFYAGIPVYWPDEFATVDVTDVGPVIIAWLIPITESEVKYIQNFGWEQFEDRLEQVDPNLLDLNRAAIV